MSFDPEFVRGVLNDENDIESFEYIEDLRQRYAHAPVFDRALNLQVQFMQTRLERKDALTAWNASQEFLSSLDIEASKAGLLGESVVLRGPGIELPKFEADLVAGVSMVSTPNVDKADEQSLEAYYRSEEVQGRFSGFTLKFAKNDDETYTPNLAYQVAVEVIDIPNAHINLFATGVVGQSQMHFEDDEKLDIAAPILERLLTIPDINAAEVNLLNMALVKPRQHDADAIRRIAHRAEKIVNSVHASHEELGAQAEDAVIDLIGQYISVGDAYYVKTPLFLVSAEEPKGAKLFYGGNELHTVSGIVEGMVFMPQSDVIDGEVVLRDRQTLHLAISHQGRHLYTPLIRSQEFTKV